MDFFGNPFLGVYGIANDEHVLLASSVPAKQCKEIARILGCEAVQGTLSGTSVIGSLVAGNSRSVLVTALASDAEVARIAAFRPTRLEHRLNAVGNNVLCNDFGAVVHPEYDAEALRAIEAALGVPAVRGTVAGMKTVGSAAVATAKGVLCHPHLTEEEQAVLEGALRVPVATSTANYGTPQVGACLLANSRGAVVGSRTTAIELGRIQEGLSLW